MPIILVRAVTKTWVKRPPALGLKAAISIYVASHSRHEWTEAEISQVSQLGAFVEFLTVAEPEADGQQMLFFTSRNFAVISFSASNLRNIQTSVEEKKSEVLPALSVCDKNIS